MNGQIAGYVHNQGVYLHATGNVGYDLTTTGSTSCGAIGTTECAPHQGVYTNNWRELPWTPPPGERATFASAATATVTFARTVTVSTTNDSTTIGFTSGDITSVDVGKYISIAGAATSCGFGSPPVGPDPDAVRAYIATVPTATTATITYTPGIDYSVYQCLPYISTTASLTATVGVVGCLGRTNA